jgi:hypothetical protein
VRIHRWFPIALVAMALCAARAQATVSLTISDNDATPGSTSAAGGGTFSFTVRLVSTAEQTTGLDYYLTSSDATGLFTLIDRNTAGGAFNDPLFFTDSTVEASPSNIFNPRNDHDLGGLATGTLNAGTYLVANYLIGVSASAPVGTYTFQTTVANANEGWIDPSSNEHPFNAHGTFSVFVPEPSGFAVAALGLGCLIRRRRWLSL